MSRIGVSCPHCGEQLRIESTISAGSSGVSNTLLMKCPKCSEWFNPPVLPERLSMLVDGEWIEQTVETR